MPPTPATLEYILLGLIVAIVAHGVVLLFKSPKEVNSDLQNKIETMHEDLIAQGRQGARHDEVIKHLIVSIERLTNKIDKLEPYLAKPPHGRQGGRAGG